MDKMVDDGRGRRWGQAVVEERVLGFWMGKQEFVEVKGIEPEE